MTDAAPPVWYIYGAGGFGVETLEICMSAMSAGTAPQRSLCFIVDNSTETDVLGYPVVPLSHCTPGMWVTIAVGEPAVREMLARRAVEAGLLLTSAIAPSSVISPTATIEDGAIVAPFTSVQARAFIGRNAAVNTMAIVGHDVHVAENAVISSMVNLGGAVKVGARAYVGMGALIREKLTVESDSIVSMGSIVHRDVPEAVIVMGDPARVIRRNDDKVVFR